MFLLIRLGIAGLGLIWRHQYQMVLLHILLKVNRLQLKLQNVDLFLEDKDIP